MEYIDLYWMETSLNFGFSYIGAEEGLETFGGAKREIHIFLGVIAFVIGF